MTRLVRERVVPRLEGQLTDRLARYFRDQYRRITPDIRRAIGPIVESSTKARDASLLERVEVALRSFSWDSEERMLLTILRPAYTVVGEEAVSAVGSELGISTSYDLSFRPLAQIQAELGRRVVAITERSRELLAGRIVDGIEKGLSVSQIVNGVPPGTTNIRGPVPAFDGIRGLVDSWASTGSGRRGVLGPVASAADRRAGRAPPLRSTRAFLIAQTETGNAFNRSALAGYASTGLVDFVEVFDGPDCGWTRHDDPDLAHGSVRALREAMQHSLSHPRCQRAFGASLGSTKPKTSPFQGRDPGNVPGATPGLRPGDTQPFGGRIVPTSPPAVGARPSVSSLQAVEDRIRNGETETAVVVDQSGNVVLEKGGSSDQVNLTAEEVRAIRGGTLTHNHPTPAGETTVSFSLDDVRLGIRSGAREVRAIGPTHDHSMTFVSAVDAERVSRAYRETRTAMIRAISDEVDRKVLAEYGRLRGLYSGEELSRRANAYRQSIQAEVTATQNELHHLLWEAVAARFPGLVYARVAR